MHEPAFHWILVSDLRPGRPPSGGGAELDKDGLDAFLREAGPTIEIPLAGGPVTLSFSEFRDFRPERIAVRLPALEALLKVARESLELAAEGKSGESLRPALAALGGHPDLLRDLEDSLRPAPAAPPPEAPKGGVFDLVDAAPAAPERALDLLLGELIGGAERAPARHRDALRLLSKKAEASLAPLLRALLHHPRFLALESAWLGLRWFVRALDFRKGARLHVWASSRNDLLRTVRELALPMAADLRSQGNAVGLVADLEFDGGEEELKTVAELAADASIPFITGGSADAALREAAARLGDSGQSAWNAFRTGAGSRWTALALNRFKFRLPYGTEGDPPRGLDFEEGPVTPASGGAPLVVAALASASYVRHGWAVDFAGRDAAAGLEPFPSIPPLAAELDEASVRTLAESGLLPLASVQGSDRVFAASAGSAHRGSDASFRQALFAAQLSASLQPLLAWLDPSRTPEDIARGIASGLDRAGRVEGGPALYRVRALPVSDPAPALTLEVVPEAGVLRGLSPLSFMIPLPR
jgi:hypothetical protein